MWSKNKVNLMKILINNDVTSIEQLTEVLNLKKRAIYFYIKEINDLLKKNNVNLIENKWNEGFVFNGNFKIVEKLVEDEFYLFSHEERLGNICFDVLVYPTVGKNLAYYANIFAVSKNTIFLDVQKAPELMKKFNLTFSFNKDKEICIEGDELSKRQYIITFVNEFIKSNEDFVVKKLFKVKDVRNCEIIDLAKNVIAKLNNIGVYTNENYFKFLISYLSILKIYYSKKSFIDIPNHILQEVKDSIYWEPCLEIFKYFFGENQGNECEKAYLVILMIAGNFDSEIPLEKITKKQQKFIDDLRKTINLFVNKIELNTFVYFNNKEKIVNDITTHIVRSFLRIKYLLVNFEYVKVIKKEYESTFNMVKENIYILENFLKIKLLDDEISLISLYFVSDLYSQLNNKNVRVALIYSESKNIGAIIKSQLKSLFNNLEIHEFMSVKTFLVENTKSQFDIVLSSVELPWEISYFKVDKVLSEDNKKQIDKEISLILKNKSDSKIHCKNIFLPEDFNIIDTEVKDWQNVVSYSCDNMLKNKKISLDFIDSLNKSLDEFKEVSIISKGVALLHGPISKNNKINCSFTLFKKPVSFFKSSEKINIIIVLCPGNSISHIDAVKEITEMLNDETLYKQIIQCNSSEQLSELILQKS